MKIRQAQRKAKTRRVFGTILMALSLVMLTLGTLVGMVWILQPNGPSPLPIANNLASLIQRIYVNTQFISWLWNAAPVLNNRELNSPGNVGTLFFIALLSLGAVMQKSGVRLSKRVNEAIERAQARAWEREAGGTVVVERAPNVLELNIELESKDQWHTRPLGMLLLAIIGGVILQWLNLKLGLAKL